MQWITLGIGILMGAGVMFVVTIWAVGRVDRHWEERTGLRSWLADDRETGALS